MSAAPAGTPTSDGWALFPEGPRPAPPGIPLARLVAVELRKSVDTRTGLWLLVGVAIAAVLVTGTVLLWATPEEFTQATFTSAINIPTAVILPIIAVLSVTAEWTQRTALTTFVLVPHRGRVMVAKAVAATLTGVAATIVAFAVGAVGNLLGTRLTDHPTIWNQGVGDLAAYTLANVVVMLVGLTVGVLIRNSAGAIATYFVYAFVLPSLLMLLAMKQPWFAQAQPWVDPDHAQKALLNGALHGAEWTHLAATSVLWLLIPALIGSRYLLHAEVK